MADGSDAIREVALSGGVVEVLDRPAAVDDGRAPLVFLHEGLGSLGLWRGFPAAVHAATGRRTVVWSRHGYGWSAPVAGPRGIDYMHVEARQALPELMERLGIDHPIHVGHSDGASIALVHAGTPELPEATALVLLAPHVVVEDHSVTGIARARERYLATDLEQRLARHHRDPAATFWGWNDVWLSDAFRAWDITGLLPGITCPVLAIQGRDDEYGTLRQLDLVEDGCAGPVARVHLDDCGHAPHLERPDATLAAVTAFLAGCA